MNSLHRDVLLQIAARIFYPTELINLALTCKRFRFLGNDEWLFRSLWLREFKEHALGFDFEMVEGWTWKGVFIWLFRSKREIITEMYGHMGLSYEHKLREGYAAIRLLVFEYEKPKHILKSKRYLTEICHYSLIEEHKIGFLEYITLNKSHYTDEVALIDTVYSNNDRISFNRLPYSNQYKDKPDSKRIILKEGLCVWSSTLKRYILLYPFESLKRMFHYYAKIITNMRDEKIKLAVNLLNELYIVEYKCDGISEDNYTNYSRIIHKKMKEFKIGILQYNYNYALKVLSFSVLRSPTWQDINNFGFFYK
jgi:hypothetical protein